MLWQLEFRQRLEDWQQSVIEDMRHNCDAADFKKLGLVLTYIAGLIANTWQPG
jgi:hypothetical protein